MRVRAGVRVRRGEHLLRAIALATHERDGPEHRLVGARARVRARVGGVVSSG